MSKNGSILAWLSGNWLSLCMLVLAGLSAWYAYQANSDASQQKIVEQVTKQVTLEKEVDYHKALLHSSIINQFRVSAIN